MEDPPIDFRALEKELDNIILQDERYWQENDAKFRAVEQQVSTYEEFRQIVKAAHLKPLDKTDKVQDSLRKRIWNTVAKAKKNVLHQVTAIQSEKMENNDVPKTAGEFLKQWKFLNIVDRLCLLKQFKHEDFRRIFDIEIPIGVLGEVFQVLLSLQLDVSEIIFALTVLEELSESRRFNLILQLLSSSEKNYGRQLLEKLTENSQQSTVETFMEEKIMEIRKKYKL